MYYCGWCGRLVPTADALRSRWRPFDSRECAAAYGVRAGWIRVEKGDKAQTGMRYSTTNGRRAGKEQARGTPTSCARCGSVGKSVYVEFGDLKSFTCYACGLEYDELPDGVALHSRDDEAKTFANGFINASGLSALRAAIREAAQERPRRSTRNETRRSEDEDVH